MRRPTPLYEALAWHHAMLNGVAMDEQQGIHSDDPQCGFFKVKLVRGGPWVPARIWLHQEIDPETDELITDEVLRCEIAGRERDPYESWITCLIGKVISEAEYKARKAHRDDVTWNDDREDPYYNPRKRLDFNTLPFPEFDK